MATTFELLHVSLRKNTKAPSFRSCLGSQFHLLQILGFHQFSAKLIKASNTNSRKYVTTTASSAFRKPCSLNRALYASLGLKTEHGRAIMMANFKWRKSIQTAPTFLTMMLFVFNNSFFLMKIKGPSVRKSQ
jgi:hypothetical protein